MSDAGYTFISRPEHESFNDVAMLSFQVLSSYVPPDRKRDTYRDTISDLIGLRTNCRHKLPMAHVCM